jgi:hypothetical protein
MHQCLVCMSPSVARSRKNPKIFPDPTKEGNILQAPSPKVARRISIQVRRRSSLEHDADKYDVSKPPFPSDERRYSPRRSEVPFHVPEKSLEVQARRDGKSSSTFLLREELSVMIRPNTELRTTTRNEGMLR